MRIYTLSLNILRIILLSLIIIIPSVILSQTCYKIIENNSGFNTDPSVSELEPLACSLINSFPANFVNEFKVYDFGYYLRLENYNENYYTQVIESQDFINTITTDYYLIITKSSTSTALFSGYNIILNIPSTEEFGEISEAEERAIENYIKLKIEEIHPIGSSVHQSKLAIETGLMELKSIISSIVAGTFDINELMMLELHGFIEMQINDIDVTHTASTYFDEDGFYDFTGLKDANSTLLMREAALAAWTNPTETSFIFTDSDNLNSIYSETFSAGLDKFNTATNDFVYWFHFKLPEEPGDTLRAFVKIRCNLSMTEVESFLINLYEEEYHNPEAFGSGEANPRDGNRVLDCELNTKWRLKNCLFPNYSTFRPGLINALNINDVPSPQAGDYQIGLYSGIADGTLDIIMMIVDGSRFLKEKSGNTIFDSDWFEEKAFLGKVGYSLTLAMKFFTVPTLAAIEYFYMDDAIGFWIQYRELIINADYKQVLKMVRDGVKEYFADLLFQHGTLEAGYAAGIAMFEIAGFVLTDGTSGLKSIIKLSKEAIETTKGVFSFKSVVKVGLAKAADTPKGLVLCKKLASGCFAKGTPVTAHKNGNEIKTKIENLELFDYVLSYDINEYKYLNSTVSTNNDLLFPTMMVSLVTPQQMERDQYELNDEDWFKITFEEINGNSNCEFAMHKDWMNKHEIHKVGDIHYLSLPEQGIIGNYLITSISHIVPKRVPVDDDLHDSYEYQPVTGLFNHISENLWLLVFDNGESINVTYEHPFFSLENNSWTHAGQLNIGESVLTKQSKTKLRSKNLIKGKHLVYNIETKNLHNFIVGEGQMIVHNNCWELIDDIFRVFNFDFTSIVKVDGKNWTFKASNIDKARQKEIDASEIIGEFKQQKIVLTKDGTEGVDAISENAEILSYKIMEGPTAQTNVTNLTNNLLLAYSKFKGLYPKGWKVEIWVQGYHATSQEILTQWNLIKDVNFLISQKTDVIDKIFYIDNLDNVIQLTW